MNEKKVSNRERYYLAECLATKLSKGTSLAEVYDAVSRAYLLNEDVVPIVIDDFSDEASEILNRMVCDSEYCRNLYIDLIDVCEDNDMFAKYIELLPDDKNSNFTPVINKFSGAIQSTKHAFQYFERMANSDDDMRVMKVLYTMFTISHRRHDYSRCEEIYHKMTAIKENHPLFYYVSSVVNARKNSKQAIEDAQRCIDEYIKREDFDENYPGIYNNYAGLIASIDDKNIIDDAKIDLALEYIDKAIEISKGKYAKYFYTKGLLEAKRSNYEISKSLVREAIDKEDSNKADYGLSIINYKNALLNCEIEEKINEMNLAVEKANKAIDEANEKAEKSIEEQKKNTLQIFGLFSGVTSLIISTTKLAFEIDSLDAMIILLAFTGILILAYDTLGKIIDNRNKTQKPTIIGLAFIIVSILLLIAHYKGLF